jgi:uncharacterized membrane protein
MTTKTGLQENVAGVLCYVLGWVSGIIMLILEPENKFVRFHAFQSIVVFGVLFVADIIFSFIPFLDIIMWPITFIIWLALIVLAAMGKSTKVWVAGDYAERWANSA